MISFLSLLDVVFAASVLAANAVLRSLFGAAFPLFTDQMYENLGLHWAASVPAFLSLVCIPFPIFFYIYGPSVRAKCKFAAEAARVFEEMRADSNRVIDESEAEEEVHDAERMQKLVKSMSKQSRKSHRTRKGSVAAVNAADLEGQPSTTENVIEEFTTQEKQKEQNKELEV